MGATHNPNAFPNIGNSTWNLQPAEGMSLRDWFAGQAMASTDTFQLEGWSLSEIAEHYYRLADAMLAAREAA